MRAARHIAGLALFLALAVPRPASACAVSLPMTVQDLGLADVVVAARVLETGEGTGMLEVEVIETLHGPHRARWSLTWSRGFPLAQPDRDAAGPVILGIVLPGGTVPDWLPAADAPALLQMPCTLNVFLDDTPANRAAAREAAE